MDLEDKLYEIVKSTSDVNNGLLSTMGFTKVNGRWVSKNGDQAGSSSIAHVEEENEVVATRDEPAAGVFEARPSSAHMDERITSMSPFKRLMVNRMDNFADNQRSLHELCATRFQNMDARFQTFDEQIEAVQNQLFELQYGKDD